MKQETSFENRQTFIQSSEDENYDQLTEYYIENEHLFI